MLSLSGGKFMERMLGIFAVTTMTAMGAWCLPARGGDAPPAVDGATLYRTKTCLACHGVDGKTPILPMYPKIAGQNAPYALRQMIDIKSGARANGQSASMQEIMYLVDEEEMTVLAEYLASLSP
jgi:cytochrome c